MLTYFISDIHVDFYTPISNNYVTLIPYYEKFFNDFFLPAEAVSIAGDIANDYYIQAAFLKFVSGKYRQVYYTPGNHDMIVHGASMGEGNPFPSSEERLKAVKNELSGYPNVHILEGDMADGFAGCMGMCDFSVYPSYLQNANNILGQWLMGCFDGRHWEMYGQMPLTIWKHYDKVMESLVKRQPKVMLTHFAPKQLGIQEEYVNDVGTTYFYFDGAKYLDQLASPSIWHCGHTHGTFNSEYTTPTGVTHRLICNPLGYEDDSNAFAFNKANGTFLIEV